MATLVAPIKVSADTDALINQAAHFLGQTKKDIVDAAVRDYVDAHREAINEGVKAALRQLDGTRASAVAMLTDFTADELDELGGVSG